MHFRVLKRFEQSLFPRRDAETSTPDARDPEGIFLRGSCASEWSTALVCLQDPPLIMAINIEPQQVQRPALRGIATFATLIG